MNTPIFIILTLLLGGVAFAQPDVVLHLNNGLEIEGQFEGIANDSIRVIESRSVYYPANQTITTTHVYHVDSVEFVELDGAPGSVIVTGFAIGGGVGVLPALAAEKEDVPLVLVITVSVGAMIGTLIGVVAELSGATEDVLYYPTQSHDARALAALHAQHSPTSAHDDALAHDTTLAHDGTPAHVATPVRDGTPRRYVPANASLTEALDKTVPLLTFTLANGEMVDGRLIAVGRDSIQFLPEESMNTLPLRRDGSAILPLDDIAQLESGDRPSAILSMLIGAVITAWLLPLDDGWEVRQQLRRAGIGASFGLIWYAIRYWRLPDYIAWKRGDDPALLRPYSFRALRPDLHWDGLHDAAE